ncbi:universal stress protein [Halorubrum sp. DTA46]|uniref:universal stress protein n=1 Tax=Halorubrum sp. DTA46 TaxID=3402162 RepID=UPI003AB00364
MSDTLNEPTVLVPVNAAEPTEPSNALIELLSPHRVVVVGYYPVPDQASPEQFQDEYGETAAATVEEIAGRFAVRGGEAEPIVVFTRDRQATIDRVAEETDCDAVLTGGAIGDQLDRILVPLKGDANLERIVAFIGPLLAESDASVTLFNVADSDEEESSGEFLLRGAADRLADDGIERSRIEWRQDRSGSPGTAIVDAASEMDLIVVGETEPSLRERLLGDVTDQVITDSTHPVLVVRNA